MSRVLRSRVTGYGLRVEGYALRVTSEGYKGQGSKTPSWALCGLVGRGRLGFAEVN